MTMIERVAMAMKKRAAEPVHNIPSLEPVLVGSLGDAWVYLAAAAIEAMHEPTQAMKKAGAYDPYDGASEMIATIAWQAMIDAALKEGT